MSDLGTNNNQISTSETMILNSIEENKCEEESSLILNGSNLVHNSTNQTNECMVEILYRSL